MLKDDARLEALKLAVEKSDHTLSASDVVARAQKYYEFLTKDHKVQSGAPEVTETRKSGVGFVQ